MEKACYLLDTTLRDGEQSPGLALGSRDKIILAQLLDELGVYAIEGGIPAMGRIEQEAVLGMRSVCRKARIAAWNRMSVEDLKISMACEPDILHISVPVSDLQIEKKLQLDRVWLEKEMLECVDFARGHGYEVSVGFEDASRAELPFMIHLGVLLQSYGVLYIRFADTLGLLTPGETYDKVLALRQGTGMEVEFHAHDDFGMAVANSIAAVQAGARYVDTTLGGIGERAGNCSMAKFIETASLDYNLPIEFGEVKKSEAVARDIFGCG